MKPGTLIPWLLAALLVPAIATTAWAQATETNDKTFEEVFGKRKTRAKQTLSVPLVLDGFERSLLDVEITGQALRISKKSLSNALAAIVTRDVLDQFAGHGSAWLSPEELQALGVTASYDPARITVSLQIPMTLRQTTAINLQRRADEGWDRSGNGLVQPLPWSAIVNTYWQHGRQESSLGPSLSEYSLGTDAALHVPAPHGAWIAEHRGHFRITDASQHRTQQWTSEMTRLQRVWTDQQLALELGHVLTPNAYGMAVQRVTGFSLGRQWSLDPNSTPQALPSRELSLPAGGTLDVEVNGSVVSSQRLALGNYDLSGLALNTGANDVIYRITEPNGRVQVYEQKYFFDLALLKPGLVDWSFALGGSSDARTLVQTERTPVLAGAALTRGVTQALSTGLGVQHLFKGDATQPSSLLQVHGTWASWVGNWSAKVVQSQHQWGHAVSSSLQWRWSSVRGQNQARPLSITVQWTANESGFATLLAQSAPPQGKDMGIRLHTYFSPLWSGSASLRHLQQGIQKQDNLQVTARRSINPRWAMDLALGHENTRNPLSELTPSRRNSIQINLNYRPGAAPERTAQWRSMTQATMASDARSLFQQGWVGQGDTSLHEGDASWQAQAQHVQQGQRREDFLFGSLQTGRYLLSSSYTVGKRDDLAFDGVPFSSTSWQTSLGTALMVSQHGVHVSRPVYDSAAIFIPRKGYEKLRLYVDPQQQRSAASSDRWGLPVLSDLMAYHTRELQLSIDPLPAGMQVGEAVPKIKPGYRSVIAVTVGTNANTQVKGQLQTANAAPVGMKSLRIVQQQSSGTPNSFDLFANRRGVFTSPPLPPGAYTLLIPGEAAVLARWTVGEDESGIKDLGVIRVGDQTP